MTDFYEDDEPVEKLLALRESGRKRVTRRPLFARTIVHINPNLRLGGGDVTIAERAELFGLVPDVGDEVVVTEPTSGIRGHAVVVSIDDEEVHLKVDWPSLTNRAADD